MKPKLKPCPRHNIAPMVTLIADLDRVFVGCWGVDCFYQSIAVPVLDSWPLSEVEKIMCEKWNSYVDSREEDTLGTVRSALRALREWCRSYELRLDTDGTIVFLRTGEKVELRESFSYKTKSVGFIDLE